jgi:hypothetical protein
MLRVSKEDLQRLRDAVRRTEARLPYGVEEPMLPDVILPATAAAATFSGARVYNDTALTITDSTTTTLTFNTEQIDVGSYHDTFTNPERLTAAVAGNYLVGCNIVWDDNATGYRQLSIELTGTTPYGTVRQEAGTMGGTFGDSQCLVVFVPISAGDWVRARVFQNSGGNLNVRFGGSDSPIFWIHKL